MWRPLLGIRDAAAAYIAAINAPTDTAYGQIINVAGPNYRISELALEVADALRSEGVETTIEARFGVEGVRNYRVSSKKAHQLLNWTPKQTVREAVVEMVRKLKEQPPDEILHPRHFNIKWIDIREELCGALA